MFTKKRLSGAVKLALGVGAGSLALGTASQALAQDQSADEDASPLLEEVMVTGTRIPVDLNQVATSPVTTVDSTEVTFSGVTRVEDLINDMPQIVPENVGNDANGATGTATVDLRGLGSARTLTLVNGHRMGAGDPYVLSPDINQIPASLVERVELLTGGASSTYGSDAVSGVVNFILKDDFDGFQFDIQVSGYRHDNDEAEAQQKVAAAGYAQAPGDVSDGEMTDFTALFGIDAADGRGNLTMYLGYRDIEAVLQDSRDYSACALSGSNNCVGSSTTPNGRFTDFAGGFDVQLDLNTGDFVPYADAYNYGPVNHFQRPDERWTGGAFAHYEIADGLEAYGEFMFMEDRSLAQIAPSGTFFNNTGLNCSNPFLSAQQFAAIGCTSPDDFVYAYVGKRNVEGGPRFDDIQHQTSRVLVGLRGDINDNWTFDVFANWSELNFTEVYNNDLSISAIINALNVVEGPDGNPICVATLTGLDPNCVPYNVFEPGAITPAMVNYLSLPLYSKADISQSQFVGYVSGDLTDAGLKLPTADNGIQVVAGVEFSKDDMTFDLDNNYNQGNAAGQGGATADVSGKTGADEYFVEARIPLIQGKDGIQDLSLDLRYRYSDYDIGFTDDTWNVGMGYSPVDSFKVRGSVSRAVRAPNINELFAPSTIGLWAGTDPCAGPTPSLTEAQCARTGVPAGFYGSVAPSPAAQYNGLFGGNPNLQPETADSLTVGFVWTPENALSGLTLSLDYWQIEVEDAVGVVDPEFSLNECATGNDALCALIQRNTTNGNLWVGSSATAPRVVATNVNIGFFEVAGYDVNATYSMTAGDHGLDFTFRGTLLDTWDDQPIAGGPITDCKGTWGGACSTSRPHPEWKHTFSTRWLTPVEGLDVNFGWRYIGSIDELGQGRFNPGAESYFDVAVGYSFDFRGSDVQLVGGVNNILDESPPWHGAFNDSPWANGNTMPATYDPLGQYWFLGLTFTSGQ